ncbi:MAG TPA: biotin transporter BioY [Terrimesophilobacter sp.]|nr:biotin transporter BioY [Terrimesophilobacter sp.]
MSDVFLIVAGAASTALLAQVEVPLWPVPSTGQTLGVLLTGATLGAVRGAVAMILYLVLSAIGLPVLAGGAAGVGHLTGPTAGYLLAFVSAAGFAGWAAQRSWNRTALPVLLSLLAASILIQACGVGWLIVSGAVGVQDAIVGGAVVLLPGTLLKTIIATILVVLGWRFVEKDDRRRADDDIAMRD